MVYQKYSPTRRELVSVKNAAGEMYCAPLRVMELTLDKAYNIFKVENTDVKIKLSLFKSLRPKNVRLAAQAQRLVCCCTYHQNVEYLRKAIHRIMHLNASSLLEHVRDNESL